jgi:hypothetical protein
MNLKAAHHREMAEASHEDDDNDDDNDDDDYDDGRILLQRCSQLRER